MPTRQQRNDIISTPNAEAASRSAGSDATPLHMNLWALKSFFFFYWAAYACTAPYLPLFAHESLGLNSREFGIIFAIVPFVTTVCRPVIGYAADYLRAYRTTLIVCLVVQLCFVLSLYFIEHLPWDTGVEFSATCLPRDAYNESRLGIQQQPIDIDKPESPLAAAFGPRCGHTVRAKCVFPQCNDTYALLPNGGVFCPRRSVAERVTLVRNDDENSVDSWWFSTAKPFDYCQLGDALGQGVCAARPCATALVVRAATSTFWLFFLLLVFARIGINSAMSLSDAIAYDLIGSAIPSTATNSHELREREVRKGYGRSRVFGTLGYALTSVMVGLALDKFSDAPAVNLARLLDVNKEWADYGFAFYAHTAATGLAILAAIFLTPSSSKLKSVSDNNGGVRPSSPPHTTSRAVAVAKTVCQFSVMIFLGCTLFIGMASGILFAFLAWYMSSDLRSSRLNIGVAFMVQSFVEAPILIMSGSIINRIGHHFALSVSLFAFGLRFLLYAVVRQPWLILLMELLHGPCFGLFYPNMVSFASSLAGTRQDIRATLQGVISAVWVLGIGFGSIVGGFFHGYFGSRFMWTSFGVGAIIFSLTHTALAALGPHRKRAKANRQRRNNNSLYGDESNDLGTQVPLQTMSAASSTGAATKAAVVDPPVEMDGPGNVIAGASLLHEEDELQRPVKPERRPKR